MCAGPTLSPQAKAIIERLRRTHQARLYEALCHYHGVEIIYDPHSHRVREETRDDLVLQRALWTASEQLVQRGLTQRSGRARLDQAITAPTLDV
jgi:hypothetical protein